MKKHDDYVSGPHSYWVHFWFGLIFGAGLGFWVGWNLFESRLALAAGGVASGLMACACGLWGDRAWEWVIGRLHWFD